MEGRQIPCKLSNPEINLGVTFGIIAEKDGICRISNIIFETYIYDHLIAGKLMEQHRLPVPRSRFVTKTGDLDMDGILLFYQGRGMGEIIRLRQEQHPVPGLALGPGTGAGLGRLPGHGLSETKHFWRPGS